jgi:hypothetical protein
MFHEHAALHILSYILLWLGGIFFLKLEWRSRESAVILGSILLSSLIDIDHLFATPIYDAQRCSIGFHPLHSYWAMPVYAAGVFWKKTRWLCLGIFIHLIIDGIACI